MTLKELTPLQQRLIVGTTGSIIALASIFLATVPAIKPLFSLLIAAIVGLAVREYYQIAKAKGLMPVERLGIPMSIIYVLTVAIGTQNHTFKDIPDIFLVFSLFCIFLFFFIRGKSPYENSAVTFFGIFYLAVTLSCILRVIYFFGETSLQDGRWWLLYLLVSTKMTDTGGFFVGKQFGSRKLAPVISPKKTWEGTIGGLCAAIIGGLIICVLANKYDPRALNLSAWQSICLSAVLAVLAQCGDLAESLLKRDGGVKDSSHLPGLGGILDIVDSLVFTAPAIYIFLMYTQQ